MKPVRLLCYMFLWTWRCTTFKTIPSNLCNCVKKPEKNSGLHCDDHWLSLRSLRRSFLHFNFISAVHIWFISYVINTHFFHGNIWTHNWPAPNVNGFIAQLVEHRTGNRGVTGSNPVEVRDAYTALYRRRQTMAGDPVLELFQTIYQEERKLQ